MDRVKKALVGLDDAHPAKLGYESWPCGEHTVRGLTFINSPKSLRGAKTLFFSSPLFVFLIFFCTIFFASPLLSHCSSFSRHLVDHCFQIRVLVSDISLPCSCMLFWSHVPLATAVPSPPPYHTPLFNSSHFERLHCASV